MAAFWHRMTGPYAVNYWFLVTCNIIAPQFLWIKKVRSTPVLLFISSIVVLVGMWLERYVIIVSSLAQDFLPSSWRNFPSYPLGLGHLPRHYRAVPFPVFPVYPPASHDLHL